jgi:hypothetical protein
MLPLTIWWVPLWYLSLVSFSISFLLMDHTSLQLLWGGLFPVQGFVSKVKWFLYIILFYIKTVGFMYVRPIYVGLIYMGHTPNVSWCRIMWCKNNASRIRIGHPLVRISCSDKRVPIHTHLFGQKSPYSRKKAPLITGQGSSPFEIERILSI